MYRRHDDVAPTVAAVIIYGSIAWGIGKFWGLVGLGGVAVVMWAVGKWISPLLAARAQHRREIEPCKHGVMGAAINPNLCKECAAESARIEHEQRIAAEQAKAAKERERREKYHAWLEQIRLPEYLRTMHPEAFEHLVLRLFEQMGYQVQGTPYQGDNGSDGFLMKDGARSVLQCKRVQGSVGEPVLRDLFGTMHATGCQSAVVVTTGNVSKQARAWVAGKPFRLIELPELERLLRQHFPESEVVPQDFTTAGWVRPCPACGKPLRVVKWRRREFMGCTGYPSCRYTADVKGRARAK